MPLPGSNISGSYLSSAIGSWVLGAASSTVGKIIAAAPSGVSALSGVAWSAAASGGRVLPTASNQSRNRSSSVDTIRAEAKESLIMSPLSEGELNGNESQAAASVVPRGDSDDEGDTMLEDLALILGGTSGSREHGGRARPDTVNSVRIGGEEGTDWATASSPTFSSSTSIKLRTDLTPSHSAQQMWQRQGGRCAGCRAAVPEPTMPSTTSIQQSHPTSSAQPAHGGERREWNGATTPQAAQQVGRPLVPGAAPAVTSAAAGMLSWAIGSGSSSPVAGLPRVCSYTGQLYCNLCHNLQTAVLPSRVLHSWDFAPQPVCCTAFDYLIAIHNQPLLCVTAINPGLYAK